MLLMSALYLGYRAPTNHRSLQCNCPCYCPYACGQGTRRYYYGLFLTIELMCADGDKIIFVSLQILNILLLPKLLLLFHLLLCVIGNPGPISG